MALTSGLPGTNDARYDATFLVASRDGRQATVMVGAFPMPATSGIPVIGASPGPITDRPTVLGYPAYVTSDGAADDPVLLHRHLHRDGHRGCRA